MFAKFTTLACLFMAAASAATVSGPSSSTPAYGGIEIGSKGVKARLFSFKGTGENRTVQEYFSRSLNTSLASSMVSGKFSETGIQEVVKAIQSQIEEMKKASDKEKLGAPEIFAIASSSVGKAINTQALLTAVRDTTGVEITVIDAKMENYSAFVSSVPEPRRDEALMVDTGSGSASAGCQVDADYKYAEIPYGSVSLRNTSIDSADYDAALKGVIDTMIKPAYRKTTLNNPCLANRARIYWIGGAAWASATFTHPERATNAFVSITRKELDGFLAKLKDGSWNANPPSLTFPKDTPDSVRNSMNAAALKDWKGVQNVFVREDLIAGVSLFRSILDQSNPNAKITFVRNGNLLYGYALTRFVEGKAANKLVASSK
jgi:hypothetical protein